MGGEEGGGEGREEGGGGGGGSDAVYMTCVSPFDIAMNATSSGGRTPGSQTPGVPATWASTSKRTEAEKCHETGKDPTSDILHELIDELI